MNICKTHEVLEGSILGFVKKEKRASSTRERFRTYKKQDTIKTVIRYIHMKFPHFPATPTHDGRRHTRGVTVANCARTVREQQHWTVHGGTVRPLFAIGHGGVGESGKNSQNKQISHLLDFLQLRQLGLEFKLEKEPKTLADFLLSLMCFGTESQHVV